MKPSGPVLFYDGQCGLCSRAVRFVLRWENKTGETLKFAPLEGELARAVLNESLHQPPFETLVVWDGQTHWVEAAACRRVVKTLIIPMRTLLSCVLIPFLDPLTNRMYRFLSRNRFKLKLGQCSLPSDQMASRFLP